MSTDTEQILAAIGALANEVKEQRARLSDVEREIGELKTDVGKFTERLDKVDGRLWTLCLSLIGTAWAAIFAASGVVIFRTLAT